MSLDPVVIEKIKKKLKEENQTEDLTKQILLFLEKKDLGVRYLIVIQSLNLIF